MSRLSYIRASELAALLRTRVADAPASEASPDSSSSSSSSSRLVVIDVRGDDFEGGHIRGCVNIPSHTFSRKIDELVSLYGNYDTVVFHCMYSQQRGPTCASFFMRSLNPTHRAKVYCLEGGFNYWSQLYGSDQDLTEDYS